MIRQLRIEEWIGLLKRVELRRLDDIENIDRYLKSYLNILGENDIENQRDLLEDIVNHRKNKN